jgi:hypothetical protein
MSSDTLAALDLDQGSLAEIAVRVTDEAPDVATLFQAMVAFSNAAEEAMGGLADQSSQLRRRHLAAFLALIDHTRGQLADILDNARLREWLSGDSAGAIYEAREGFDEAGEGLYRAATNLVNGD